MSERSDLKTRRLPTEDLSHVEFETSEDVEVVPTFDNMGLRDELVRGIYAYGFKKPFAIQQRSIIPIMQGENVIMEAPCGTGKTVAFSIGILQSLDVQVRETQVLILSPTRELATQIQKVVLALGNFMSVECEICIGGTNVREGVINLINGPHVVCATPGRLVDMMKKSIKRNALKTQALKMLVVDESDKMFSEGFKKDIDEILQNLPKTQVVLASIPSLQAISDTTSKFMTDPIRIIIKQDELDNVGIKHFFLNVKGKKRRLSTFCDLLGTLANTQVVIFCNSKNNILSLTKCLREKNFDICSMHGDMKQVEKEKIMEEFRSGACRFLITSGVLARGIFFQKVPLVVNYDLPKGKLHHSRIGHLTGFGRKGVSINLVTPAEIEMLREIHQDCPTQFDEMPTKTNQAGWLEEINAHMSSETETLTMGVY